MEVTLNKKDIEAQIIDKAVNEIFNDRYLNDLVLPKVDKAITEKIDAAISRKIEDVIQSVVDDGLDHVFQRVDSFGRKQGKPTTIARVLEDMTRNFWSEKVDKNGKVPSSTYRGICTRAEYVMTRVCAEGFSETMHQHTTNIAGHLKDGLRSELRKHMDKMLDGLFKVRSLQDSERPFD